MTISWQQLIFLLAASGMLLAPASGDRGITITKDSASIIFPRSIRFQLEASSADGIQGVTLIYGVDRLSCQPSTSRQALEVRPGNQVSLAWDLEFDKSGMIPPGAEIWWQWVISADQGVLSQTEKNSIRIQDERFEWRKLDGKGVSVQWHQGSSSFGQAILQYAEKDLQSLSSQMGIHPTREILITVYASTEEMREALVRSADWVGAVALPDYGSVLLGLSPSELGVADYYISHELAHLIVGELTFNCLGVDLPTWLNEGLAENTQGEPSQEDLDAVILAIESQQLPALSDLAGGFSANGDRARLEYIQSRLVVKFLLKSYGSKSLADLLASFQSGSITDEALQSVYGMDSAGIDRAWRKSLGFRVADARPVMKPTRTPVPTMALWTAVVPPPATLTPAPVWTAAAASTPVVSLASPTPIATHTPDSPIQSSPEQSIFKPCMGLFLGPAILFLFLIRRKECVS